MGLKDKNIIDSVIYGYTAQVPKIEDENRILKQTIASLRNELDKFKEPPSLVCEVKEVLGERVLVQLPNGNVFYVNVSAGCGKLHAGDSVLVEQKNLTVIRKVPVNKKFNVEKFVIIEKPKITWKDVGGLEQQTDEIKEVIELPLKKPKLFKEVGIQPPKGILLYGPPGTGKTLLAKAVASSTNSTFIEIVSSELVQKFIGEGAKLVKEIFQLAKEKAPAIIFIDELDALAAVRVDVGTSGEREVQRTFMQLLAEIDGFKALGNVKVIGCTNRRDILDPAILRPGRLDRLIKIPLPERDGREKIFSIHTQRMVLDSNVDVKKLNGLMEHFSGAEIHAVCTEAGYFAIRGNRTRVSHNDFENAINKVREEEELEGQDYLRMFG
jgi:proteasome regulatory subunit